MDDDWQTGEERRAALRNLAAYREVCRKVRRGTVGGLMFGGLMLAIWYFLLPEHGRLGKYGPFGLSYLGLAALEFTVAIWNRVRPSPEGVLFDGVVLLLFGAANLLRAAFAWQDGRGVQPVALFFGAYLLYQGYGHVTSYRWLRRLFAVRPSADQVRWFDGLLRDVRAADPGADPDALDLPTKPPVRGRLLGDTAVFVEAGGEVLIAPRAAVEIVPEAARDPDRPPAAFLTVGDADYGRFPLDPDNWRNYTRWKAAGGEPVGG